MAIVDVVKCEMIDGEFCQKFQSEDLSLGAQLIVYPAQTAFFVKGGSVCDEFTAGTHTLKTKNIPILDKIINIPFGNNSPFKAEVWYINQIAKLDINWGTPQPIQIEDPKYNIIVPVRAHGQYGIRISNPRIFLESLIGNMTSFTADKIEQYFKGRIISYLNNILSTQIIQTNVSVLDINTHLISMASDCETQLNEVFAKYGVSIVEFSIMSITVPQDDASVVKLKQAKDLAARLNITGRDVYQMERSFDVLEKAASNEGAGGDMMAMGAGMGMGAGLGSVMGGITAQTINTNPIAPPPIPKTRIYFLYVNGQQVGGLNEDNVKEYISNGSISAETLIWWNGLSEWVRLSDAPEFNILLTSNTPPPIKF